MTTKVFKPGDLLTASDVNNYLVNDSEEADSLVNNCKVSLNDLKQQVTAETLKHENDIVENALQVYIISASNYDMSKRNLKAKTVEIWQAAFPANVEIVAAVMLTSDNNFNDAVHVKIENNTVQGIIYNKVFHSCVCIYKFRSE